MPIASSVFPTLSSTSFKVSDLILMSLVHFELILVQGEGHESSFNFLEADIQFSQQKLLKRLLFLYGMFLAPLTKLGRYNCMDSYLGLLFCSTGLIYFPASTMLLLWLWLCLIWAIVIPPTLVFFSVLPSLFPVFCASK
jgi:hypothetical protein